MGEASTKAVRSGLSALIALVAMACDNGQNQKPPASKQGTDDGTSDVAVDTSQAGFDAWCAAAAETKAVQGTLAPLFPRFCTNGKATSVLKSTLVKSAFSGSGTPRIKSFEALHSDAATKTTKWTFGVGIKLPISIKDHFDRVGPKAGDQASLQRLAADQGATAEVRIEQTFQADGKYHERGWLIYQKITKPVGPTTVITETRSRNDQYKLMDGKHYLYAQHTEQGLKLIKKFDLLTAGVQINEAGYLLSVVDLEVETTVSSDATESEVKKTALDTIKQMYAAAQQGP